MPMAGPVDVSLGFPCRLHIVVQVIGSLDEVEIFIAFAYALKKDGHRIRIASHDEFRSMVEEYGLEFFPVGGDPAEFVPCVVSSPRLDSYLTPTPAAATARRRLIYEDMLQRLWESCVAPDPDQATDRPFIADVIIANPASFAHVHCAERLKIPCHLISTIPWTSTAAFAHPLAGAKFKFTLWKNSSNGENSGQEINMNVLSFMATNLFAWQE
jgi:UDP:flavonoid glycosyltransferase YjiC (YdhE family)